MTICCIFISPSFKLIIFHNHFQKQKKETENETKDKIGPQAKK